jgi:hypothetical protein
MREAEFGGDEEIWHDPDRQFQTNRLSPAPFLRPVHHTAVGYMRTDGVAVDPLHEQATLAQCKGEAVSGTIDPLQAVAQARKETTIIDACMARNGYVHAQQ